MTDCFTLIKELITFYAKTNYEQYLKDNNIKKIQNNKIQNVVNDLYDNKKDHIKTFLILSMKELLKDEYPGDLIINNIIIDILRDEQICKNTIISEIQNYQKKNID